MQFLDGIEDMNDNIPSAPVPAPGAVAAPFDGATRTASAVDSAEPSRASQEASAIGSNDGGRGASVSSSRPATSGQPGDTGKSGAGNSSEAGAANVNAPAGRDGVVHAAKVTSGAMTAVETGGGSGTAPTTSSNASSPDEARKVAPNSGGSEVLSTFAHALRVADQTSAQLRKELRSLEAQREALRGRGSKTWSALAELAHARGVLGDECRELLKDSRQVENVFFWILV